MNTVFEVKYNLFEVPYLPMKRGKFYVKADDIKYALAIAERKIPEQYESYQKLVIEITSITKVGELLEA